MTKMADESKNENLWRTLDYSAGRDEYVYEDDREGVTAVNDWLKGLGTSKRLLHTDLLPEPFVGAVETCRVLLLLRNPGYHPDDDAGHADPALRAALTEMLRGERRDHPFVHLDPAFAYWPGAAWWVPKLSPLIRAVATKRQSPHAEAARLVSEQVAAVELYPYHSTQTLGGKELLNLPSSQYVRGAVERAIQRKAKIVLMWKGSRTTWIRHVPALEGKRLFVVTPPRPYDLKVSGGSLGPEPFLEIVNAITA